MLSDLLFNSHTHVRAGRYVIGVVNLYTCMFICMLSVYILKCNLAKEGSNLPQVLATDFLNKYPQC